MSWIDLGNPRPRIQTLEHIPVAWDVKKTTLLSTPVSFPNTAFIDVLQHRFTRRKFGKLTIEALSQFLWLSSREIEASMDASGFQIAHKPVPSAGALHPIHVLIANPNNQHWQRYNPVSHSLEELTLSCAPATANAKELLEMNQGSLLMFVAEPGRTESKYEAAQSLILRDAGAILGVMALCAEYLSLNFCPLGITGEPWASKLGEKGSLVGAGMAVIGSGSSAVF